jgi:hypothetical protein
VFEAIAQQGAVPFFAASLNPTGDPITIRAAEDVGFCKRVRAAGFEIMADTSIRLWKIGTASLGWEDAGGNRERHDDFTLNIRPSPGPKANTPTPDRPEAHPDPPRNRLRVPATPLREGFPRIGMYVVTYAANAPSLEPTLASIRASDWGQEPVIVMQPTDWPVSRDNGSRNYKRALGPQSQMIATLPSSLKTTCL